MIPQVDNVDKSALKEETITFETIKPTLWEHICAHRIKYGCFALFSTGIAAIGCVFYYLTYISSNNYAVSIENQKAAVIGTTLKPISVIPAKGDALKTKTIAKNFLFYYLLQIGLTYNGRRLFAKDDFNIFL